MFTMDEYGYQFEVVQDNLKHIVDINKVLQLNGLKGSSIVYKLRMVGTTPQSAIPTIVINCKFKDQDKIRDAFKRHSTDNFYCYPESKKLQIPMSGSSKIPPPFCLVYESGHGNPYKRNASELRLSVSLSYDSTLYGSLVSFQGRSATLALTLKVDSKGIVLTAGHLKPTRRISEPLGAPTPESIHDNKITLNGDNYIKIGPLWFNDDNEYNIEAAALQSLPPRLLPLDYNSSAYANNGVVSQPPKMQPAEASASLSPSKPDLDWILLKCDNSVFQPRHRNFIYLPEQPEAILLKEIATRPRIHAVPVFMVSGVRGVIRGRMLGLPTFIGSEPNQKSCKVWSIVLNNQFGK